MKKLVMLAVAIGLLAAAGNATAGAKWPDKGWHKGPYLAAGVGMAQVTNDKHSIYNRSFNGPIDPAFGLTFGWDIADWIGPMLQVNFATTTGQTGDPNNTVPVTYNGITYSANTFPLENARQYSLMLGLFCRATAPYFINAGWQKQNFKFIPYLKLGAVGNAVYVNAPTSANKAGAVGGGIGVGGGVEFFIWKGIFIALDVTENIIFQQGFKKNITDSVGVVQNVAITKGGTQPQFSLMGLFGYHF